jgi:hypothetical protein
LRFRAKAGGRTGGIERGAIIPHPRFYTDPTDTMKWSDAFETRKLAIR